MANPQFESINPHNGEIIARYPLFSEAQTNVALDRAHEAFGDWKKFSFSARSDLFLKLADVLRARKPALATLMAREMGKILKEGEAEIEKCAVTCEYYAAHAEAFLADEAAEAGYAKSFVSYAPIGVVLAIMPWNFPFWQVIRFAAPSLMAGNTGLLKHAPNVCGCALALETCFREAGFPEGVFTALITGTDAVERLLASPKVRAVTLTGSERAGSAVAAAAGKQIKTSVMELGGSDAFIVLDDADLDQTAVVAAASRMQNAGQSCIAAKRFIVVESVHEAFLEKFAAQLALLRPGDPLAEDTTLAPMARPDLADALEKQLAASVAMGAALRFGGARNGCHFAPTLLAGARPGMPAFDEETFGPLAAVIPALDEEEAIRLANASRYGLSGSVWTRDPERGVAVARRLDTGAVFVNCLVKSDARLPFGGVKHSGYGRELGRAGMLEFVNVKPIAVQSQP